MTAGNAHEICVRALRKVPSLKKENVAINYFGTE
jgi:hypothetical protein